MAFVQFSGVTYHDPKLAYDSYVLYTGADGVTRLIDLDGWYAYSGRMPAFLPGSSTPLSMPDASATSAFS
jgi:hypothetical protein